MKMRTGPSIPSTGRTLADETWWLTRPGLRLNAEAVVAADPVEAVAGMAADAEPVVGVAVAEVVVGIEAAIVVEIVATAATGGKAVGQFS
jgi:hypothetical protein